MKPAWDKLIEDFKDSKTALVADVDCTAGGSDICQKNGVEGYPTIKYGDPNDMTKYEGGRDYDSLKKFADENLGPTCGPDNLDLCNEVDKALIEKFTKMTDEELDAAVKEADAKIDKVKEKGDKAASKIEAKVAELNEQVEKETKNKDEMLAKEKKKLGLGMMKAVSAAKKKSEESSEKKGKKKKGKKNKKEEL